MGEALNLVELLMDLALIMGFIIMVETNVRFVRNFKQFASLASLRLKQLQKCVETISGGP